MADYIYMMESRLSPEQQRGAVLLQDLARAHEMNLYLTGGTIRDIISGFTIRDLDFTVEGNPLRLQRELEKAGTEIQGVNESWQELLLQLPGSLRASINMARSEKYGKPGKPPDVRSAPIMEDLRRRDFTVNAMALSLNPGSRGLLLDPANGLADLEAKLLRILHNYSFLEDPSRLIRATRFMARFHWTLEERTQARYDAAIENDYIEHMEERAAGQEIEQLAYEDEPMPVMKALEKEGWLKALHPRLSVSKIDTQGLAQLLKTRQQMVELGYTPNISAGVMYFLMSRVADRDVAEMQHMIPRKGFVKAWQNLESDSKQLAQRLNSKEAAVPSKAWNLLTQSRPELIAFLETTARQQAVKQKIRNFLGKWRQIKTRFPLPQMTEMRITPDLPAYPRLANDMFFLMLDGKLRSSSEIAKYLKPFAPPPPPPPPPPPKKGRVKKHEEEEGQEKAGKKAAGAEAAAKTGAKPAAAAHPAKEAKKEVKKKSSTKKKSPAKRRSSSKRSKSSKKKKRR